MTNFAAVSATSGFGHRNAYVSAVPEAPGGLMWLAGLAGLAGLGLAWRRLMRRAD